MNFYSFHIGDYATHTAHLEPMEDLAYRRLLDLYYRTESPLPEDVHDVARLIRMKDCIEAVDTVLMEFFELTDAGWQHARCDAEIAKMQDKQSKAKASAQASVNARSTNAQRTLNERAPKVELPIPIPIPIPKEEKEKVAPQRQSAAQPSPPPPFDGSNAEVLNGKSVVAIAPNWELPADWGEDAEALGWQPSEVLREAEKFRQYWVAGKGLGKRRNVKGWRQSWSNWLAKAAERRP